MYGALMKYAALSGIALLAFDTLARKFYWYVSMPHSDRIAHTLGGMFAAFLVTALSWRALRFYKAQKIIPCIVFSAAVIGIAWEYYEYIVHVLVKHSRYVDIKNTISDILFDVFGGVIAAVIVFLKNKRYNGTDGYKK